MKTLKRKVNVKASLNLVRVKTGTVEGFFSNVKKIMRIADRGESIKKHTATLTFVDLTEMLHFLSAKK